MAKYIDNVKFYNDLIEYNNACNAAIDAGMPVPDVPNVLGKAYLDIAKGLASTYRFVNYTYKDDLIGDAVETCVKKTRNFDVTAYDNPFAYFTQICWFAFINYTGEEYKQKKIIYRACENLSLEDFNLDSDDVDTKNQYLEFLRENIEQRELDRLRQQTNDKKFVHRMITKQQVKETIIDEAAVTPLPFDE